MFWYTLIGMIIWGIACGMHLDELIEHSQKGDYSKLAIFITSFFAIVLWPIILGFLISDLIKYLKNV